MKTKNLAMTAVMAALMCLAGMALRWVSPALVPFSILPIIVYLSGLILGAQYGALAMIVYIVLGLFGLPVFATAPFAGIGYVLKPTFGYMIGYVFAAYVTGLIYKPESLSAKIWGKVDIQGNIVKRYWYGGVIRAAIGVLAGLIVIYLFGLVYLYGILNWYLHKPMDWAKVIAMGFTPFILFDLIKAVVAVWVGNEVAKRRASANA